MATLTDVQIHEAVKKAKQVYKTAETKIQRKFMRARDAAFSFHRDDDDVERAARHNEIKRAEAVRDAETADARISYIDKLESLRARAGEWAELVPRVGR